MTLTTFLAFWHTFVSTHVCFVWLPGGPASADSSAYHVAFGGDCTDGFRLAQAWHSTVGWATTPGTPAFLDGEFTFL